MTDTANPFDTLLGNEAPAASSNPFDALADEYAAERERRRKQQFLETQQNAQTIDPARQAQAIDVAKKRGVPVPIAYDNLDELSGKKDGPDFDTLLKEAPETAKLVSDPVAGPVAFPDHQPLADIEKNLKAFSISRGLDQPPPVKPLLDQLLGDGASFLTPEQQKTEQERRTKEAAAAMQAATEKGKLAAAVGQQGQTARSQEPGFSFGGQNPYTENDLAQETALQEEAAAVDAAVDAATTPPTQKPAAAYTNTILRTLMGFGTSAAQGVSAMADSLDYMLPVGNPQLDEKGRSPVTSYLATFPQYWESLFPEDKGRAKDLAMRATAAVSSGVPFLLGSMGMKALGYTPGWFAGLFGGLQQAGQGEQDAVNNGASINVKNFTTWLNFGLGTSEAIPIEVLFATAQTGTRSLKDFLAATVSNMAVEATQNVGQQVPADLWAQLAYDPKRDVWGNAAEALKMGAIAGGLFGAVAKLAGNVVEANHEKLIALGEAAKKAKIADIAPKILDEHIARLKKSGAAPEQVTAPAEAVETLFQEAGPEAAQMFPETARSLAEAKATGVEVSIPTEELVRLGKLTGYKTFAADVRIGDEMTLNEVTKLRSDLEKQLNETDTSSSAPSQDESTIYKGIRDQLLAAGQSPDVATAQARLMDAFFTAQSERTGVPAADLARRYGVEITNSAIDAAAMSGGTTLEQAGALPDFQRVDGADYGAPLATTTIDLNGQGAEPKPGVYTLADGSEVNVSNRSLGKLFDHIPATADVRKAVLGKLSEVIAASRVFAQSADTKKTDQRSWIYATSLVDVGGQKYVAKLSLSNTKGVDGTKLHDLQGFEMRPAGDQAAAPVEGVVRPLLPAGGVPVSTAADQASTPPGGTQGSVRYNLQHAFDFFNTHPQRLFQTVEPTVDPATQSFLKALSDRVKALINPIYTGKVPTKKLKTNEEAARWLEKFFTGDAITDFTAEIPDAVLREIGDTMAAEAIYAMRNSGNAYDWYSEAMQRALQIASIKWPMLANDASAAEAGFGTAANARFVFTYIMAVTSQNLDVAANAAATNKAFDEMLARVKAGDYTMSRDWGTGDKQEAMGDNFDKFGPLIKAMKGATFAENLTLLDNLFRQKMTVAEWVREMKAEGVPYNPPGQTAMDAVVYGSSLLGPKIGNGFWQNLNGNFSPLTIDLWMRRTWGRLTGKSIGNESSLPAQRARLKASVLRSINSPLLDMDPLLGAIAERRSNNAKIRALEERTDLTKKAKTAQIKKLVARNNELEDIAADYRNIPPPEPWKDIYDTDSAALAAYAKRLLSAWNKEYKKLREQYGKKVPGKLQPTWARGAKRLKADLTTPLDQVANGTQRKQIEKAVGYARQTLTGLGHSVTMADLQAILWYPEKELWGALTSALDVDGEGNPVIPPSSLNESYDTVFTRILNAEGYQTQQGAAGDAAGGTDGGAVPGRDAGGGGPGGSQDAIVPGADGQAAQAGQQAVNEGPSPGPSSSQTTLFQSSDPAYNEPAIRINGEVIKASDFFPNWPKGDRPAIHDMSIADQEALAGDTLGPGMPEDPFWGHADLRRIAAEKFGGDVVNRQIEADPENGFGFVNAEGKFKNLKGQRLNQGGPVVRGSITFGPLRDKFRITLTEKANLSTFIHEGGHFFLEVLQDLVARGEASAQQVADLKTLKRWMAIEDGKQIDRPGHEKFARTWEQFIMEGKAPSLALHGIFQKFKAWMIFVYKRLANVKGDLNDEIREVMDRLVASDAAIAEARALVGWRGQPMSQEETGLTDAEYKAYVGEWTKANDAQSADADARIMLEAARSLKQAWTDEKNKVTRELEKELSDTRGWKTWQLLTKGEGLQDVAPGWSEMKIDPESIPREWRRDAAGMTAPTFEGGLPLDLVAEKLGFTSGEQMLSTIAGAKLAQKAIPARVRQIMAERHGEMNAASLAQEAMKAVHNTPTMDVLLNEFRALAAKANLKVGKDTKRMVRAAAEERVAQIPTRQLDPGKWRRAEVKAAEEAGKLAAKGRDMEAALAKRRQLMAAAMAKASLEAQDRASTIKEYLSTFTTNRRRAALGRAGETYLDAVDQILEGVQFKEVSLKAITARKSLAEFIKEQEAAGEPVFISDATRDLLNRKNYTELTLEELEGVHDAVKNLWTVAKDVTTVRKQQEKIALEQALADITAETDATLPEKKQRDHLNPTRIDKMMEGLSRYHAGNLKIEFILDWLGKTAHGLIYQPISEAAYKSWTTHRDLTAPFLEKLRKMPKEQRRRWTTKRSFMDLPMEVTGANVWMAALNLGNSGNKEKLLAGYGWSEARLMAELNQFMTKEDWDLAQETWDTIEKMWPQLEAVVKKATGLPPPKVEATPIVTPFGTYRGGYFPVVYDTQLDERMANKLDSSITPEEMFAKRFTAFVINNGFTKGRTANVGKLLLSPDVIADHLSEVIHYVTHYDAVRQADKIMRSPEFKRLVKTRLGNSVYVEMKKWLVDVATNTTDTDRNTRAGDRTLRWLRQSAQLTSLGFNVLSALKQPLGVVNALDAIGPVHWAHGVQKAWLSPSVRENWRFAFEHSKELGPLLKNYDRDAAQIAQEFAKSTGSRVKEGAYLAAFMPINVMQATANVATWHGAYLQATKQGMSEAEAYAFADKTVRMTQGAGGIKDMAGIQRGGEANKLFTMFYSYFSVVYNRMADIQVREKGARNIHRKAMRYTVLLLLPSLLNMAADDAWDEMFHEDRAEKKDETPFLVRLALETFSAGAAAFPVAREFYGLGEAIFTGNRPRSVPAIGVFDQLFRAGSAVKGIAEGDDLTRSKARALMAATGIITGTPIYGIYRAFDDVFGQKMFDE